MSKVNDPQFPPALLTVLVFQPTRLFQTVVAEYFIHQRQLVFLILCLPGTAKEVFFAADAVKLLKQRDRVELLTGYGDQLAGKGGTGS